ncbi:hypothetical protein ACOSQ2_016037 [Xanthoceras sorbifolium]
MDRWKQCWKSRLFLITLPTVFLLMSIARCKIWRAKELFLEMHARNMMPSTITYTSLLNGYCKEGNLMEALKLRDFMSEKGIRIRLSAYRALITALGGKEEFSEAFRLLDEMGKGGLGPSFRSCKSIARSFCKAIRTLLHRF